MGATQAKPEGNILPRPIEEEMKQSYVDYAMSVIVGRALPDVRDGLKPVHRRILFAMHDMGMLHNRPFKKSARVVGEVLGKYHPHGDSAVYDSLVRMAQEFSLRYTLIDGQGNFGSIDGDSAAAMRYTESRLKKIAEEMLLDIDKETVEFVPNFDGSLKEPSVLPAKLPNLLVNGSSGIAVGMATNIPPHNLKEVAEAIVKQIERPDVHVSDLVECIKGPDFPTGGIICGKRGIYDMYTSGRGKLVVRATTDIESSEKKRAIIVSDMPYMVNKADVVVQIAQLVNEKRILGISDIRDESDRQGIRVVIELKREAEPEVVLNQLYKNTRLQTTFGVIMLALVQGEPKVLNLKDMIQEYIGFRKGVIIRRASFDKSKAEQRAHILEGLIIALDNIDAAIVLIKDAKSSDHAKQGLIAQYSITDVQAQAILDMKLSRLTGLEQEKIREERRELLKSIEELAAILASEQKVLAIIRDELISLAQTYGDERKTMITEDETDIEVEDLIKNEKVVLSLTHAGYVKRQPIEAYRAQRRGGKGVIATGTRDEDFVESLFAANNHDYLLCFTDSGKVHWMKVYQVPETGRTAQGKAVVNLLELQEGEKISSVIPVQRFDDEHFLIMATRKGTVKKTALSAYSNPRRGGIIAITLDEGDGLINVVKTDGRQDVILATRNGQAVRFSESDVRPTGRSARGVRGVSLKGDDSVIAMVRGMESDSLLTLTENGYGKRTAIADYRRISRGGSGVRNIICSERNGFVAAVLSVTPQHELMVMSKSGIMIRIPATDISEIGRNTQGVRVMRLEEGDLVVAAAKVVGEGEGVSEEATDIPVADASSLESQNDGSEE